MATVDIVLKGVDNASGVIKGVGGALGGLADIAGGAFNVAMGAATAGVMALGTGLAYGIKQAMDTENAVAQLDAVLKSTGAAATKSAEEWAAAQGQYVTSTRATSDEVAEWGEKLEMAQAKLADMQERLSDKEPTEVQKIQMRELGETIADLQKKIASGGETIKTSLVDALNLVAPVARPAKEELLALASAMQDTSVYSDDAVIGAESMLLTFTKIGKDVFPGAIQATLDMATAFGGDLASNAMRLGKALNDPIDGITALSRIGVTFSAAQEEMIKKMVAAGDVAGAQKLILEELTTETGGSAAAAASTFSGTLTQLQNRMDGVAETIGEAFLPILKSLIDTYIKPAIPLFENLALTIGSMIGDLAKGDIGLAFDDLREGLGQSFEFIGPFVDLLISLQSDVIQLAQAFGMLINGDMSLNAFSVLILKIADEYLPGLREQFQPLVLAVVGLGEAFAASLPLARLYVELFVAFITEQFQMLGPQLTENLTATVTTLTELWQKYGDDIMRIVTIAFSFLAVTIGGTLLIVSGIITTFLQVLNGDWTGAWQTIQDTTATFLNMVLALVGQDLATFTAIWSTNWANFLTIVTFILESIGQGVIDFGTFVAAQFTGILNTLLGIAGTFSSVGSAIIDGITAGVNGAVGGLIAAAVGAVNSAVGAAKSALGIQSPSTVFASMGENMMAGMAQGLQSGTPVAAQASVAAAQQVTSTTNNYTLQMANYGGKPSIPDLFQQQERAIAGAW